MVRPEITLRPATQADADFLWELHCAALKPHVLAVYGWDEAFQRRYYLENYSTLHNKVIQYLGTYAASLPSRKRRWDILLSSIELLPQFQGMGVGTELITDLLDRAAARGCRCHCGRLRTHPARRCMNGLGSDHRRNGSSLLDAQGRTADPVHAAALGYQPMHYGRGG